MGSNQRAEAHLLADYTGQHLEMYAYRYRVGLKETKLGLVAQHLKDVRNRRVLDVGCGIGVFSQLCSKRGATVYSVDPFSAMTHYLHVSNRKLSVATASGRRLPFKDKSMDCVLVLDVIEHVYRPLQLLKEVYRVLRGKGRLLLTTDNPQVLPTHFLLRTCRWMFRKLGKYPPNVEPPNQKVSPHVRLYSVDEMISLLEAVGFTVLKYETFSEGPCFAFVDSSISRLVQGNLKKWKWNSQFILSVKP
jgi:ubiquinone/menaquinone biosynthesis C-methylase UbiE